MCETRGVSFEDFKEIDKLVKEYWNKQELWIMA